MENANQQLIVKLKAFKQQGLTFYQATERLKQGGYSQEQIDDIADQFNYTTPPQTVGGDKAVLTQSKPLPPASSQDYERLGNAILADKERSARPYAYVALAIPCGYLGQGLYRFWLNTKFRGSSGNQHYLWANNLGYYFLSGAIGAGIAIVGLKIYFRFKDKKYKQIDKNLSKSSDQ